MYKLIPTGQNTVHLSQLLCLVKLNININNGTKTKWRLRCKRSHSIGHFNHFKNKQLNETNEEKKILITEKHSVKKNQAKQICIQSEKLTSLYGKTKRESDMGNFKVFAADMPAGPASFQKPLFIGTLSLFDWFEIISCKPQNYLFILFNGPLQRQRVQFNYMYQ